MTSDDHGPSYDRMIEGLRVLAGFGMTPIVDLDDRDAFISEAKKLTAPYYPDEIEAMNDEDLDGYLLLDLVRNVVLHPVDSDYEPGEYSKIVSDCATVASGAFPATDITEQLVGAEWRVTWKVRDESFKTKGSVWLGTPVINQGVSGSARFFDGGWDMCGYMVYLTPEQAVMARAARGWHLS